MITLQNDKTIHITVGASRKSTKWATQEITLSALYTRLETPLRGIENINDYLALSKAEQDERKDVGGFVGGVLKGQRRKADNVESRDIVTLDIDTIPPFQAELIRTQAEALGCGYLVYPTRKDRPAAPRKRLIVPTNRSMTVDEYDAVSRRIAALIGIEMCDPTTFEPSRLMYWPSCCADSDYQVWYKDAPALDVDKTLASYTDWKDWNERPQVPGAISYQKLAVRQGDPESKPGVIGAFNRVYDIYSAMDELLPGIYAPCDNDPHRFTYLNGSTTGGAIIYDDGKFLYSHHATDPCGGKLVNAADLVRLHKFGQLDINSAIDTPINKLPSYKAFCEFAVSDQKVATLMMQERYNAGQKEFEGVGAGTATQTENTDPDAWLTEAGLQLNPQTGAIYPTIDNIRIILECDPMLKGRFALNKFAGRGEVLGVLPWDQDGKRRLWSDTDTNGLYWYMEKRFNITKRQNIDAALDIHASVHAFNDVQDYIKRLVWDMTPRLDTVFIDYLGAADNEYNRAVCRKSFTAAIARAMEPGCKYDNMLILCGRQGLGKSTLLDKMSRGWFNDSIRTFEGKEASELLQGVWLVEVAELDAFRRTDVSRIKQFLSLRADRYRAAYGRNVKELPRCCAFFGTCNQMDFLQDMTGNRRFWPVDVGETLPVGEEKEHHPNVWDDLTDDVIDQLWAEAKARWQIGEQLYLSGEIEKQAQEMQEQHREASPKEGVILNFIGQEIPEDWQKWTLDRRRDWWAQTTHGEIKTVKRTRITAVEIWCEAFNNNLKDVKQADSREINAVIMKMPNARRVKSPFKCGPYGVQRGFELV
jgi:predicted P-loop ATPase